MKLAGLLILTLLFLAAPVLAQEMNKTTRDIESDEEILIGLINRDGLKTGLFAPFMDEFYPGYEPDKEIISKLKGLTMDIDILIVLGTWCGDSQEQVPRFLKVIDKMKFPKERLVIVGVDREKVSEDMEMSNYDIVLVPTMIVFRGREEIGRITETPETTLEQDLLSILE